MDDHRVQPNTVQEVERESQGLELVRENSSADLEHSEVGGRGEDL